MAAKPKVIPEAPVAPPKHRLYNAELGPLNDFKNFLYMVWMFIPAIQKAPTRIQYDMADYLQNAEDDWSIIMAYRGIGKSYITAAFVVWLWMIDPEFKILVLSASEKKAGDFAFLVRQIISGIEVCNHLQTRAGQRDSTFSFDVGPCGAAKDPSLNVYGIGGQITGGRADFIIPDDIETPDNSITVVQREKLITKLDEVIAIIKPTLDGMQPQIKVLGTPQSTQSIYFALEKRGYVIRVWPARYPTDMTVYGDRLAPLLVADITENSKLVGTPVNPLMHNEADLTKRAIGKKGWFLLQYMLDPSLSDADKYPLKLSDFMVMHIDPEQAPVHMAWSNDSRGMIQDPTLPVVGIAGDRYYKPWKISEKWLPYTHKLLVIDPAGGNDETAYAVLYYLMGYIYVVSLGGIIGGMNKTFEFLADLAAFHGVNTVLVERNFGAARGDDGEKTSGFTELLRPVLFKKHKCALEVVQVTTQKEKRICDDIEAILGAHRVVISESVIKADFKDTRQELQGLYQLTHITRDRGSLIKDDRVDALALGFAFFLNFMKLDVDANEEKLLEEYREDALKKFMRGATKGAYQGGDTLSWLNLGENHLGEPSGSLEEELMAEETPWWIPDE